MITATATVYRVCFGWSAYEDFDTPEAAIKRAAQLLDQPMNDESCQRVSILAVSDEALKEHGYYPTLIEGRRKPEAGR